MERAFGHHPIDRQRKLLLDLLQAELVDGGIAAPLLGQQGLRIFDRSIAALDRYIHGPISSVMRWLA